MPYLKSKISPGAVSLSINRVVLGVAKGLLGLFLPIFLYEKLGSIKIVLLYFLFYYGIYLFSAPVGAMIASWISFRWSLILSIPLGALFYFSFYLYDLQPALLLIFSIIFVNLFRMLYWVPFHTEFAESTSKRDRGKVISIFHSIAYFVSIFLPAVAGFIIAYHSYNVLFLITVFIFLCSGIPFLFLPDSGETFKFSYWETWRILFHRRERRLLLTYMADGAQDTIHLIIWPIFIFQILQGDYKSVGIISSIIILVTIVLQLAFGKLTDTFDKKKLLKYGTALYSLGWLIKIFVNTGWHIFVASTYHNLSLIVMRTPFDTLMYEKAADLGQYVDEYSVLREMALIVGRILVLLLLLILVSFIGLKLAFILAAIASLFINLI